MPGSLWSRQRQRPVGIRNPGGRTPARNDGRERGRGQRRFGFRTATSYYGAYDTSGSVSWNIGAVRTPPPIPADRVSRQPLESDGSLYCAVREVPEEGLERPTRGL
jgi:hypothetical protein